MRCLSSIVIPTRRGGSRPWVMVALGVVFASPVLAAPSRASAASTADVIVRYLPGAEGRDRGRAREEARVVRRSGLSLAGAELVRPEPGVTVSDAVRELERDPDVAYAEPNAVRRASETPDDPLFQLQWGLSNVGQSVRGVRGTPGADLAGPAAWDITRGPGVVVAVVDSGVAIDHPDLAANVWRNPGEAGDDRATNGRDDDGNGYVDDSVGYDVVADDASPRDEEGHGTHVAGIVGAVGGNGIGVTGVAPATRLMALRVLGADGSGTVADAVEAYSYAARNGARIVNLSLGGAAGSRLERDALAEAGEVLFVAAAGNDGTDTDATPDYPCSYALVNVLCVAASDNRDRLASFSNVGVRSVDLAAPGVDVASTLYDPMRASVAYGSMSGTSMAAPMVSGVAALVLSVAPGLTVPALRDTLLSSVDPIATMAGRTVTGGRVDAAKALAAAAPTQAPALAPASAAAPPPAPPEAPPPMSTVPGKTVGAIAEPLRPLVDVTAPGVVLVVAGRRRLPGVRREGFVLRVTCSEACTATATLDADATTARRARLPRRRLARDTATLASARTSTLRLRLGARAKRRLAPSDRLVLRIEVRDAAGNARRVTRTIILRR